MVKREFTTTEKTTVLQLQDVGCGLLETDLVIYMGFYGFTAWGKTGKNSPVARPLYKKKIIPACRLRSTVRGRRTPAHISPSLCEGSGEGSIEHRLDNRSSKKG